MFAWGPRKQIYLSCAERSEDEWAFGIVGDFGANVLDPPLPFRSEEVEAKAVLHWVGFRHQAGSQNHPLGCIDETLKDRVLHSLSMIFAQAGYSAQTASSGIVASADIVADKNHHGRVISRRTRGRRRGRRG